MSNQQTSSNSTPASPRAGLPEDQRRQLDQIRDELEPLDATQAIGYLTDILANIPDDEAHALMRGAVRSERADRRLEAGRPDPAWEDAREALEAQWRTAATYATAGWAAYSSDRPGRAREQFDRALELESDDIPALTGRGLALMEINELELARSDFTHAINLDPDDPELYGMRSEVYVGLNELDKAAADIRRARKLAPRDPEFALAAARLMMVQGNIQEANEAIDEAIDEEDPELEALLLRSHLRLLSGDSPGSRRDAIRASNHAPDEAFAFVQLAHSQLAEGNLSLAMKAAERAVKLDSSLPDAYMVRGAALQRQGEHEQAREDLERARQAPAELPMFLLGSFYDVLEASGFNHSMMDLLNQYSRMRGEQAGGAGPAGMPDFDPQDVVGNIFDDSGNLDDQMRPFLEMAIENAPSILKNLPPGLLSGLGGLDADDLEDVDLSDLSSEDIEDQMKQVYEMMQSGENPFEAFQGAAPSGDSDESDEPDDE